MGTDATTAQMILSVAASDVNKGADLYKEIMSDKTTGPTDEARAFITANMGKRVKNIGDMLGTLVGVNETTTGLYNGNRYPALIKLDTGQTFEYCLSTFTVVEDQD